nr:MAG TPA: hypothetical protein [Caudoviricetes sp.]
MAALNENLSLYPSFQDFPILFHFSTLLNLKKISSSFLPVLSGKIDVTLLR